MAQDSKAQIVEIATEAFARSGFATTSLRSIAKEAGVSPALVVFHFGSREKLIEECIGRSLGLWVSEKQELGDLSLSEALSKWQGSLDKHGSQLQFFRQVLLSGEETANVLFSRMVQESQIMIESQIKSGKMRKVENPADLALIMTLHGLAPLILQSQVNNHLGGDFMTPTLGARLAATSLGIYQRGIYTTSGATPERTKEKKVGKK